MSTSTSALVLAILILVALLSVASRRSGIPAPIFMLLAGIGLSLVPGLPRITLEPDLVLLLLLPPLLYSAGVGMSWPGFRANLRPILLLAIGCVLFTAMAVAAIAHVLLGLPWAAGFVLGAIVSPPDAVAPMAIARRLGLPNRLLLVLEGESLVNDATALVVLGIALNAMATGSFSLPLAGLSLVTIAVGEIVFGVALGWTVLRLRRSLAEPSGEILLALATPFLAFWPPHALGGSGVIACVAAGLYVSWNGRRLISSATRLQGYFIWRLIVSTIELLVFLLTGLQAGVITASLAREDWGRFLVAGAVVSLTVIVVRFVWVYPATYLPRLLIPAIRRRDPYPNWRVPFMISFTGLRGVVSLAAALSIPLSFSDHAFPERNLVLFVTFFVIVATLVGLGAMLPWMIRVLGLERAGIAEAIEDKRNEQQARISGVAAALSEIDRAEAEGASFMAVAALRRRHADRHTNLMVAADDNTPENPVADVSALEFRVVEAERQATHEAHHAGRLSDEARRRIERELDLEEARIQHQLESARAVRLIAKAAPSDGSRP